MVFGLTHFKQIYDCYITVIFLIILTVLHIVSLCIDATRCVSCFWSSSPEFLKWCRKFTIVPRTPMTTGITFTPYPFVFLLMSAASSMYFIFFWISLSRTRGLHMLPSMWCCYVRVDKEINACSSYNCTTRFQENTSCCGSYNRPWAGTCPPLLV